MMAARLSATRRGMLQKVAGRCKQEKQGRGGRDKTRQDRVAPLDRGSISDRSIQ